jgi:two-component system response regulator DctR
MEKPVPTTMILERMQQALRADIAHHRQSREQQQVRSRLSLLSDREREVMLLAAEGLLNKQIASELHISIKTVEAHRAHIRSKLGIDSILEMARLVALAC